MGVDAYTLDFEETYEQMNENISCYNCHENQAGNAGELVVIHSYVTEALGDNMDDIDAAMLALLKTSLEEEVAAGDKSEEELDEIRSLYRNAQWYWDFCYVENSEGAHNSTLAHDCLDKSEALVDEAMSLLQTFFYLTDMSVYRKICEQYINRRLQENVAAAFSL